MKIYTIHHKGLAFFPDKEAADKCSDQPDSDSIIYEGKLDDMDFNDAHSIAEIHPAFSAYYNLALAWLYKTYRFKSGTESPRLAIHSRMNKKEAEVCGANPYVIIWEIFSK